MYRLQIHKAAEKATRKAPEHIREKAFRFLRHLRHEGTNNPPCRIKAMQGPFKKQKFRRQDDVFYVRLAGTHNELHTG